MFTCLFGNFRAFKNEMNSITCSQLYKLVRRKMPSKYGIIVYKTTNEADIKRGILQSKKRIQGIFFTICS